MFPISKVKNFFLRAAIGFVIGMIFGYVVSEVTYNMTPNKQDASRQPQTIQLVIPYGTADQVAEGIGNRSLPTNMDLVQGDVLIVKNEDKVAHQVGPLFIPPSTSSALSLDNVNDLSYACSFVPTKKLGINVKSRVDSGLRFEGVLMIGLPTGMMLAVYSYMFEFGKKKENKALDRQAVK